MSSRSRRLESVRSDRGARSAQRSGPVRTLLPAALIALVIVGAGLWFLSRNASSDGGSTVARDGAASHETIPAFVTTGSPRVREAYDFAAAHGAELAYIPCYCGCGGHSGHRNVRDCFIKSGSGTSVTYEEHGSQCDICVSIVLDSKAMLARGDSLAQVRATIDLAYADVGPATDTPLPPGMEE